MAARQLSQVGHRWAVSLTKAQLTLSTTDRAGRRQVIVTGSTCITEHWP